MKRRDFLKSTAAVTPAATVVVLIGSWAAAGRAFAGQDDAWNPERGSNPPWFPSLMAFEHYDSGRTKLLQAVNGGTMVEPAYAGRMYLLAQSGNIIELTVHPRDRGEK